MRLAHKIWLSVGIAVLLAMGAITYASYRLALRGLEGEMLTDGRTLYELLMSVRRIYMRQFLQSGLPLNERTLGLLPAHSFSSVSQDFNPKDSRGIIFRNVSDRPRNPANMADGVEMRAIRYFRRHPEAQEDLLSYTDADGARRYLYATPIWVSPFCLQCHGKRADAPPEIRKHYNTGFGYKLGELRGILSIKMPARDVKNFIIRGWVQDQIMHLASYVMALVLGGVLLHYLVVRKLAWFRRGAKGLAEGDYAARVPVVGNDEITELARTFNDMAARLAQRDLALRESNQRLHVLFTNMAEGVTLNELIFDASGQAVNYIVREVNTAFEPMSGLQAADVVGRTGDVAYGISPPPYLEKFARVARTGQGVLFEAYFASQERYFFISVAPWGENGFATLFTDITERRLAEERIRQSATVFENTREGVVITDPQANMLDVNRAFCEITGYGRSEAIGHNLRILQSGRHDREFFIALWRKLLDEGHWQGEIWNRRKDGEIYPEWLSISAVRDDSGRLTNYVGVFSDISAIKRSQEKLEYLAHHDALTGLPNRLLLSAHLQRAIQQTARSGDLLALLFLDMDRFKHVNDSLGHPVGDSLLQFVAKRLLETVRRGDTVARLGGDEFVVLTEHLRGMEDAAVLAEKLTRTMAAPFRVADREFYLTMSLGISLYPQDGLDAETLLKNADAAMYRAKDAGRNTFQFYTRELTVAAFERMVLQTQLRGALERDELLLHYQPQVELESGRIVGMEALLRWQHRDMGLVSPDRFIPLAEETGLIIPIGEWVLRAACIQAKAWLDRGLSLERMAVNVSGPQIRRSDFVTTVRRVLSETGLAARYLELEVTETFVMGQGERAVATLQELRDLGASLSIDDFGTGYSSLAYLKRLPIHTLKIDRGFVHDLPEDENDASITRAVIAMGHSLGLRIIAEGVETEAQRAFLHHEGCEEAQGYFFSRPLPADAMAELLTRGD